MKIEFGAKLPVYHKPGGQTAVRGGASPERAAKTDVADFSRGLAAPAAAGLSTLKAGIVQDVAASVGTDKLAELKERLRAGSYHPSTDEIVDAILGS